MTYDTRAEVPKGLRKSARTLSRRVPGLGGDFREWQDFRPEPRGSPEECFDEQGGEECRQVSRRRSKSGKVEATQRGVLSGIVEIAIKSLIECIRLVLTRRPMTPLAVRACWPPAGVPDRIVGGTRRSSFLLTKWARPSHRSVA